MATIRIDDNLNKQLHYLKLENNFKNVNETLIFLLEKSKQTED